MAKRGANKELNHDNWNDEDEPEEMGRFRQASDDQLAGRQIKKARRRGVVGESPSSLGVFKSFQGFNNKESASTPTFSFLNSKTPSNLTPSFSLNTDVKKDDTPAKLPGFSFLSASKNSNSFASAIKTDTEKKVEKDTDSSESKEDSPKTNGLSSTPSETSDSGSKSKGYLTNLKALNLAVLSWIQQHINKNPYVNLMPVFDDYKKHIEGVISKYKPESGSESEAETPGESSKAETTKETKESDEKPTPVTSTSTTTTSATAVASDSTDKTDKPPTFSFTAVKSPGEEKKPAINFGTGTSSSLFSFGKSSSNITASSSLTFGNTTAGTTNFFGAGGGGGTKTGFSFSSTPAATTPAAEQAEEPYEPPKEEVVQVKEEDALYEKKCKLFFNKDGQYVEKGVGMLYLKPAPGEKTQLLIRADTNLGNILLNILLNSSIPAQRVGKNNVLIVCVPNPPIDLKAKDPPGPTRMLIRVKTGDDADELHSKIEELKK